jgi:hypothetical protein
MPSWVTGIACLFGIGVAAADDSAAIRELLDRAAIQNLLARSTYALDTLNANEFASLFTMNAAFHADTNVVRRGRVQIHGIITDMIENNAAAPAAGLEVATAMHHVLTNSRIEVLSEDEARHYGYPSTRTARRCCSPTSGAAAAGRAAGHTIR